jgi:hypothetical protein
MLILDKIQIPFDKMRGRLTFLFVDQIFIKTT